MTHPLAIDLDHVLAHAAPFWEQVRGGRIFVTGGTGFFGRWLLESFAWANARQNLGMSVVVLSRRPDEFARRFGHLATDPSIRLVQGDVRTFEFPAGAFSHVIHAATDASAALNETRPLEMLDTIVAGTRRVLDFAGTSGARDLLLTSSGAVYGTQPEGVSNVTEEYAGAPDPTLPASSYGEGKRLAEQLCAIYARDAGLRPRLARCFAFVGPHLPFSRHYAVGNFLKDGLDGGPIVVKGDGTPLRSYLYAADLVIWLLTILARGQPLRPYNVGSDEPVSIADLARAVGGAFDPVVPVEIRGAPTQGQPRQRYVPSTRRAREELGLAQYVTLADALVRTIRWARLERSNERCA